MLVANATALVTGANRGFGAVFARALLERGARKVYAAARDPASITIPGVVPVMLDVTNPEHVHALRERVSDLTLLVNNAGVAKGGSLLAPGAVAIARTEIETNYLGPLAVSNALAPVLADNGGGAIINVLSVLSWLAFPGSTGYSASKAAGWALSNGLRNELRAQHTQVLALHVGFMDTDMVKHVDAPKHKPEDIVRLTLDALEAGKDEILADELSQRVKAGLSAEPGIYTKPRGG